MDQDVLQRFRQLEPFTLDELVEAANTVLRRKVAEPLTRRTVRYYIVEFLVPPAEGPPTSRSDSQLFTIGWVQ